MAKDVKALFEGKTFNKPNLSIRLEDVKEKKTVQSFMFESTLQKALKKHFEDQGLTWGVGLRKIIIEYMRKEKIIK